MKITPDPVLTTVEFDEQDKLNRIMVDNEDVFNFNLSQRWFISKVSMTRTRNAIVITLERGKDDDGDNITGN